MILFLYNTLRRFALTLCGTVALLGCESNPIGDDDITGGRLTVRGEVVVSGGSDEDVLVWLEDFDLSTRTDAAGDFSITIPPADVQSAQGGVTGGFKLYFYLGNFRLESKSVLVQNGEFVYSEGALDEAGALRQPVHMIPLLEIKTVVLPDTIFIGESVVFSTRTFLSTGERDTVDIYFPRDLNGRINPMIFREVNSNGVYVFDGTTVGVAEPDTIRITNLSPKEIVLVTRASTNDLPLGTYEAIPYLFIVSEEIPSGLLEHVGADRLELGAGYLDNPFVRDLSPLHVLEAVVEGS